MSEVTGTNNSDIIDAADGVTEGNDEIHGLNGWDVIFGLGGHDVILGGHGGDHINGGDGIDTAGYWDSNAAVSINLSTGDASGGHAEGDELISIENLNGSHYDDILIGNSGANELWGSLGDDIIKGAGGSDVLNGGDGADRLEGGSGIDTAEYWGSGIGVIVSLETGSGSGGHATGDTLFGIENLSGSNHGDILIGNDAINYLRGHDGTDTLKGGGGADGLWGGDGNDILKGGGGADTLRGENGIDTAAYNESTVAVVASLLTGGSAGDAAGDTYYDIENLTGSGHGDTLAGNSGINVLRGLDGNDTLSGMQGYDTMWGGNDDDTLDGGSGGDTLYGENGNDTLIGGTGVDTMIGGLGNDTYMADLSSDIATEAAGGGHDLVYAYADYVLSANIEELSLNVGTASSAIGNGQDNVIYGNALSNFLNGGDGADQLSGLGGNDTFVFQLGQAQGDSVYEFQGNGAGIGDILHFSGYGTAAQGATLTQLTATDWQITSADGLTQETITLVGAPAIDASDYIFV
jgi:Ca2+-binding RTX toxin-like protein